MKNLRRISMVVVTAFLFAVMAGSGVPQTSAATSPTDISGHWANSQISYLLERGVISGFPDGTFKPNDSVTRAEFMTMINRAFNFSRVANIYYYDVIAGNWYYNDVAKATVAGYIAGYPDGSMHPDSDITREETAVILAKVSGYRTSGQAGLNFTDAADIAYWALSSVQNLIEVEVIGGYPDGSFKPGNSINRAEAAVLIYNSLVNRVAVTDVDLDKASLLLAPGRGYTLTATVDPSNAFDLGLTWSSSDTAVATVNNKGRVIAVDKGVATITVTTTDGNQTAACLVTVADFVAVNEVSLNKSSATLGEDETLTLKATIKPAGATNQELIWSSSDEDVATVSSTGKVTGESEGSCIIKAETKDGRFSDRCDLTVNSGGLILSRRNLTMDLNAETTIRVYLPDEVDVGDVDDISWDTDNLDIADISSYDDSNDSYLILTIISDDEEGDCSIDLTIEAAGEEYTTSFDVTVESTSTTVEELTLSDYKIDMNTESEATVYAYLPGALHIADVEEITYESSNNSVAEVTEYDDSFQSYVIFTISSHEVDNDCTITINIVANGDEYSSDCLVVVAD